MPGSTPRPSDLNLHHLRSFWIVAREGSITRASEVLGVTPSTLSAQVSALEEALDTPLFRRHGNRLEITRRGLLVQRYAAEIFALSGRLMEVVTGRDDDAGAQRMRLSVGIVDTMPLLSAHTLLGPALALPPDQVRLILRVGTLATLLGGLGSRTLDLVLTDTPVPPTAPVRVETHPLATGPVILFAAPTLARTLADGFPGSLDGAPFLLHTENTALRAGLDRWFTREGIRPFVAAEVEDVALLQLLGQDGRGVFAAPALARERIVRQYGVEELGPAEGVTESFHGVVLSRAHANRAVEAVLWAGRGRSGSG
ncbi:MAG: LysR family transcriptional regulator [Gemmatimonadales bacterium]|nr:MAG: LysR family transcriptional regulator [Gemmatimonadales bacterium]